MAHRSNGNRKRNAAESGHRGSAPVGLLIWLFAGALFVAPFLREADGPDDTTREGWVDWPREAVNSKEEGPFDIPFEEDVRYFEEDFELDLSSFIATETDKRFAIGSSFLSDANLIDWGRVRPGQGTYRDYCAGCHGDQGDGAGPAARYLNPRPRNFRKGLFKFTSTSVGSRPLREDIFRTVTRGLTGSSMPNFRLLSEEKRWDLVEYVRYLSMRGEYEGLLLDFSWEEEEFADPDEAAEILLERWSGAAVRPVYPAASQPEPDSDSIERGRLVYLDKSRANCAACHGETGLGDGPSATAFEDAWGYPVQPRDLTTGVFRAGSAAADIYLSIATGINGTPMPAFGGSLEPEEIWDLTHYVQSLGGNH